jgi:hypothetical protein
MDWHQWHDDYDRPDSTLGRRLEVVQEQIRLALDAAAPGPLRAVSMCAGQGSRPCSARSGKIHRLPESPAASRTARPTMRWSGVFQGMPVEY